MILAKEISVWTDVSRQPNHTYLMSDSMDKIIGYFKWNKADDFMMFKNPLTIDTRYRKFKVLQRGYKIAGEKSTNKSWIIKGSKDHEYVVEETPTGLTCSCIGYKYHGKCKHIDQVKNESQ